ncbi:MAG TPA: lipid-binding SYLF domain-containing protein [Vicinamibacterales bacterium]|nr:lipid-binding SYLF domain-containing protein [Vicinamibacterales bacterium]
MKNALISAVGLAILGASLTVSAAISDKLKERVEESATVLTEIHSAPDKDIPKELWDRATCVIVIPSVKKAAFVFGGEYGKGLMSCRKAGGWSAPVFMELQKGSWGLQIGAQSIDLVLLVSNERGMKKLLGNKVTLGAEASVAAGPVGRDARAATDAQMNAEILSYSRAQGLFAGINLSGGVLKPDSDDNEDAYGKKITPAAILTGSTAAPAATAPFMKALQR